MIKYILFGIFNYIRYNFSSSFRSKQHSLFEYRQSICNHCSNKKDDKCNICGCYIILKTKVIYHFDKNNISIDGCPLKKW